MPRSLIVRRLALVFAAGALVAALPAGAAHAKPGLHITDPTGDANGLNGQDVGLPVPSESTAPADVSGDDITKIDLVTDFIGKGKKRKAAGWHVSLTLAAPLQKGTLITVTMDSSAPCGPSSTIQLGYGTSSLAVCQTGGTTNDTIGSYEASADGKTITWYLDPVFKPGTTISNIYASTSVFVFGVFDEATSQGIFTYGK